MKKTICELFAGVGGFRLGFEKQSEEWKTVWFSQWEPDAKHQWAHECYVSHWGEIDENTGKDIGTVNKSDIPDHNILVGGFPCQDYSVAHTLATSHGIEGKKGVLWWQIRDTLITKKASFCIFENVDRLLRSPAKQRGRDFGIILACLYELGYCVEWRVINAAEYGAAQRRRRTFIFAYRNDTQYAKKVTSSMTAEEVLTRGGLMAQAFPINGLKSKAEGEISEDIVAVSDNYQFDFKEAGYMRDGFILTAEVEETLEAPTLLKDILVKDADEHHYITDEQMPDWQYMKGAKKIERTSKEGYNYLFSEGPVAFPDPWDRPGRTMLTSEHTKNRSTHVVEDPITHKLRLITPIEAERLQGFNDDWTNSGMPEKMRYFCMGNALVVPMITRMARILNPIVENEPEE